METPIVSEAETLVTKLVEETKLTKKKMTVIVTVQNFEESLDETYLSLKQNLEPLDDSLEIVFVDDGSSDKTWDHLQAISEKDADVKAIRLRADSGEAAAFDAGLKNSDGDKIIFMSSRKRIDPAGLPNLLNKLDQGFHLVIGWRHRRADSKLNQVISKGFNWLVKKLYRVKLNDVNSGVFVAKREIFEEVPIYGDMNIFVPVLAARKGFKVGEEKIDQLTGSFRQSKFVSEYIQRILDVITVIFLMNYSKRPLHFLGFLGFIFTFAGAFINMYLFIDRMTGVDGIAGRPMLLLGALLLVIGIQMISIGLIGEIIIFTHAHDLKEYSIEEILE